MPILDMQRRQRELGRIRIGEKGSKGEPKRLSKFRLTSPARHLLDAAAGLWGGEVREWSGAPSEGQFELYTDTDVLPILIPPGREPISQWYEQWTGGGCTHRCDGVTNVITDSPCSCDPDNRACKATTRINVMLPDIPDVGVWRLETHGWYAANELPGIIDVIQMASGTGRFLAGRLRIENRTSKSSGQTRRYVVPVIDLDVTARQLMTGEVPEGEPPPLPAPETPQIEAGEPEPEQTNGITRQQQNALWAKAREVYGKEKGVAEEMVRGVLKALAFPVSTKELSQPQYAALMEAVRVGARPEDDDGNPL